ncbi:MAG: hypothetical protein WBD71_08700 [Xanthobacteraceae bacterium]
MKPLILVAIMVPALLAASQAVAQNDASPLAQPGFVSPPARHVSGRITIHPGRLLYRRCTDWYELQHRPSGTVLFPEMRCWWVRG